MGISTIECAVALEHRGQTNFTEVSDERLTWRPDG